MPSSGKVRSASGGAERGRGSRPGRGRGWSAVDAIAEELFFQGGFSSDYEHLWKVRVFKFMLFL